MSHRTSNGEVTFLETMDGTPMRSKSYRRKPDLFTLLIAVVLVGMAATLAYQISVYSGVDLIPIARQNFIPGGVGG